MKMLVVFAAAAVALPAPAFAQGRIPDALTPASRPVAGIIVTGRATVRMPVKNVRFVAQIRGDADVPSALDAMRAAGISEPFVGPLGNQPVNGQTIVRGVIRDVSRAKLESIGLAATMFTVAHPGLTIANVAFFPAASECAAAAEQTARVAAFEDARRRAGAIAAAAGLPLGAIESVTEAGGCPIDDDRSGFGGGASSLDLGTLTFAISISEGITFGIGSGDGSMRRPQ